MGFFEVWEEHGAVEVFDTVFTSTDDLIEYIWEINDNDVDISKMPTTYRFCSKNYLPRPNAETIVATLTENMEVGVEENLDIEGLQMLLDYWYRSNKTFEFEGIGSPMPISEEERLHLYSLLDGEDDGEEDETGDAGETGQE